jgi:hypothetical protein
MLFQSIDNIKPGSSKRFSSWDRTGGNADFIKIAAKSSIVLADIKGPGRITHIWMTSWGGYRNLLLKFTWDNSPQPSIIVPYGDFFGQGNCIVNSFQSAFFTSSTDSNNKMNELTAMNCYLPMPFKERAVVELVNDGDTEHIQYFYIDYETYEDLVALGPHPAYLHAEFRRQSPFGGWGPEIWVNSPESDSILNVERDAWNNNYVILETKGHGHYLGCFFNVINLQAKSFAGYGDPQYSWWGEGDDMIWVDGYKWPPDLHGTGSEDYFNQALGMQRNAYLRNGTAIHEFDTEGYSTSYMFHIENPVRFQQEIKVTIEIGHGNHLGNDISSVAFWYAEEPTPIVDPPSVAQRQPILKKDGEWIINVENKHTTYHIPLTQAMIDQKREWKRKQISQPYKKIITTLTLDEENQLSADVQISPQSVIQIPFTEVLDDLLDNIDVKTAKFLRVSIFGTVDHIKLEHNFPALAASLIPALKASINKKVKIISGRITEEERDFNFPEEYCIIITDKISFRD